MGAVTTGSEGPDQSDQINDAMLTAIHTKRHASKPHCNRFNATGALSRVTCPLS